MVLYLLLGVLTIYGVQIGNSQVPKECNNCNAWIFGSCFFTNSYSALCADDTQQCGNMTFSTGAGTFFKRFGCFAPENCNKTNIASTGVFRFLTYSSTCCSTNFCNGAFTTHAPHLITLLALGTLTLRLIS